MNIMLGLCGMALVMCFVCKECIVNYCKVSPWCMYVGDEWYLNRVNLVVLLIEAEFFFLCVVDYCVFQCVIWFSWQWFVL